MKVQVSPLLILLKEESSADSLKGALGQIHIFIILSGATFRQQVWCIVERV